MPSLFIAVKLASNFLRKKTIEIFSFYKNKLFLLEVFIFTAFLQVSYEVQRYAAIIATQNSSNVVNDLFFQTFPYVNTNIIHGDLSFFLFDIRNLFIFFFPRHILFTLKSLILLILFRSITINLTNLGIPEDMHPVQSYLTFGGDLFFSGHVAIPVLLGLVFWDIKILRYFFFILSFVFGISAMLGHYHYSIDVISAPFFAYGIFTISKYLFKKDYEMIARV